ncbi:MAG: iron-containing redox enzyme family protein [Bdellovibrionales bacterium]
MNLTFADFIKHISEETAHEVLAEKDLHDLGMTPEDFRHLPETRALWEPQYYKIQHEHPLALMGYIIALEYFACTHLPSFHAKVSSHYGGKACRFIKLHAEEDPDHTEKALELTSKLSKPLQEIILINVIQTAHTYTAMVNACVADTELAPARPLPEFGLNSPML